MATNMDKALKKYKPISKKVPKLTTAQATVIGKMKQSGRDKKTKK